MATNPSQVTTLAQLRQPQPVSMPAVRAGFFDAAGFELMQRVAKAFAASTLVPEAYRGNLPNCMIAINMAERMGADPMMVMQNLYIVHGRPDWSAQFLIATFNHCGRFSAIRYEWFGTRGKDDWGCRAFATEKENGERIVGPDITIALAKAEGWEGKSGSKWKTIPQLMLMYRAAAWLVRTYAPEIAMGLQTAEELGDVFDAQRSDDGSFDVTLDTLRQEHTAIAGEGEAKAPAETIDTQTGELLPATPAPDPRKSTPTFIYAEVTDALQRAHKAKDTEAFAVARDMIRGVGDEKQRAELDVEAKRLAKDLG